MNSPRSNLPADNATDRLPIKLEDLVPKNNVKGGKGKPQILFGALPHKRRAR